MKNSNYHMQITVTVPCTNIIMEATKGIGQRDMEGATRDFFF